MSVDRRTPREWTEYLSAERERVTLTEYMAGCLSRILACVGETAQASAHVEGMLGAIDEMCARNDPRYAGSGQVRAALDRARDEQRTLAAAERSREGAA